MSLRRAVIALTLLGALVQGIASADEVLMSADSSSSSGPNGREKIQLKGNAYFKFKRTEIHADSMEVFGKNHRYVVCQGKVSLADYDRGLFIKTDYLDFDRTSEFSIIKGPTTMEDKKNNLVIKGYYIENDSKKEVTIIQISVKIMKDDMVCRAEYALYRRAEKTLNLSGRPYVKKDSDEYRADQIRVNLDNNEITMEGNMRGKVFQPDASPSPLPSGTLDPNQSPSQSALADLASPAHDAAPQASGIPLPDVREAGPLGPSPSTRAEGKE